MTTHCSMCAVIIHTALLFSNSIGQTLSHAPLPVELSTLQCFTTLVPKYSGMMLLTPNMGESRIFQADEKNIKLFLTIDSAGIQLPEPFYGLDGPKATYGFRPENQFRKYGVAATLISSRSALAEKVLGINQKENHFYLAKKSIIKNGSLTKSIAFDTSYGDLRCHVTINGKSVLAKVEFDVHESLIVSKQFYSDAFDFRGEELNKRRHLIHELNFCGTMITDAIVVIAKSETSPLTIGFDLIRRLHSEFSFIAGEAEWAWIQVPVGFQMPNQYRFDFVGYMTPKGLEIDEVASWGIASGILQDGDLVSEIGGRPVRQRLVCYCLEAVANEIIEGGSLKLLRGEKWMKHRLPGDRDATKRRIEE